MRKEILDQFAELSTLEDGWGADGDEPVPNKEALKNANDVLIWATENNIECEAVDPDCMGGVSLTFDNKDHQRNSTRYNRVK